MPEQNGCRLIVTDYLVDETCSLFAGRKIPHQRRRLFNLIDRSKIVNFTWIEPDLFAEAREWMLRYEDQPFAFTDCTSFACLTRLDIRGWRPRIATSAPQVFILCWLDLFPRLHR